jgi:hypothetical protein
LRSRRDPTSPSSVAFDLSPEFLLCPARALLQTSEQLVFLAFGVSKIIVGELRVFLLQLSLYLVPSAFECEFVHSHFSFGTSVPVAPKAIRARASSRSNRSRPEPIHLAKSAGVFLSTGPFGKSRKGNVWNEAVFAHGFLPLREELPLLQPG